MYKEDTHTHIDVHDNEVIISQDKGCVQGRYTYADVYDNEVIELPSKYSTRQKVVFGEDCDKRLCARKTCTDMHDMEGTKPLACFLKKHQSSEGLF